MGRSASVGRRVGQFVHVLEKGEPKSPMGGFGNFGNNPRKQVNLPPQLRSARFRRSTFPSAISPVQEDSVRSLAPVLAIGLSRHLEPSRNRTGENRSPRDP